MLAVLSSSKTNINTMSAITSPGRQALEDACELLQAEGKHIIAVVASYTPEEAEFDTLLRVKSNEELGLSRDHIVLDSLREVTEFWSKAAHG